MRTLEEAALEASTCTLCRLANGRTQVVYGVGDPHADLMFIGEGPGFHEDRQGQPFVGAAGQLLNRMLGEIGLARENVYVANCVKCLRYNAQVQLGDGSWERIGRLVARRYEGTVMSVDTSGALVAKRVTGWHATPLGGRRVFRLTFRSSKPSGVGRANIELTGDHPVLTDRGYVNVEDLTEDDLIATGTGLTELELDVVCGTVLGDGHIGSRSSRLSFSHGPQQREYARFKAALLSRLGASERQAEHRLPRGGDTYTATHVTTKADRALRILRAEFYEHRKRAPFWLAHALSPRMLAFWFMDDGYMRIRPGRGSLAEIAAVGFSEEDRSILLLGLAGLGLPAKSHRGRIYFDVPTSRELSKLIAPFVPPSMRYKLDPEVEQGVPFDPSAFEPGSRHAMFDSVEVEDVTDRPRTDTTFFCIDVEETHNFVTSGGVVHNCRPPNNRDPLPDELDACTPYLREQIRLVDPHVVVTLGNFATRYVLRKQVSISRVRGQRFVLGDRVVIPTFHPAAILHGGGEGSPQMEALRSDFQVVKVALAEIPEPVEEQLGLF